MLTLYYILFVQSIFLFKKTPLKEFYTGYDNIIWGGSVVSPVLGFTKASQ
jgi:hypothetical protein